MNTATIVGKENFFIWNVEFARGLKRVMNNERAKVFVAKLKSWDYFLKVGNTDLKITGKINKIYFG